MARAGMREIGEEFGGFAAGPIGNDGGAPAVGCFGDVCTDGIGGVVGDSVIPLVRPAGAGAGFVTGVAGPEGSGGLTCGCTAGDAVLLPASTCTIGAEADAAARRSAVRSTRRKRDVALPRHRNLVTRYLLRESA
jgi:hypothetical protein